MEPLDALLPALAGRVIDVGEDRRGEPFARLDNDLYLHAVLLPGEGSVDTLHLQFYLFFNPDGSHARPTFEVLRDLLGLHLGYSLKFPGEFWGSPAVRVELRRLRQASGWRDLSLALIRVKKPRPNLASAPRMWVRLAFPAAGWRHGDLVGSDWTTLSRQLVSLLDQIVRLLDMVRPRASAPPLHPH